MARLTLKKINAELKKYHELNGIELVKGERIFAKVCIFNNELI